MLPLVEAGGTQQYVKLAKGADQRESGLIMCREGPFYRNGIDVGEGVLRQ
jgi:hypothetical protein